MKTKAMGIGILIGNVIGATFFTHGDPTLIIAEAALGIGLILASLKKNA